MVSQHCAAHYKCAAFFCFLDLLMRERFRRCKCFILENKYFDMLSQSEIEQFIKSAPENDPSVLKDYYDKCYDNLKDLNARSNKISVFLLLLLSFFAFSSYIKDAEFFGIKLADLQLITRLTPLFFSFFLLEWCLLAKRRRGLMMIIKPLGAKVFGFPGSAEESVFTKFSEHSLNVMPFSFMIEILNINHQSRFSRMMFKLFFIFSFLGIPCFILAISAYTIFIADFSFPFLICNIISLYCLSWVVYFYLTDFGIVYNNLVPGKEVSK